MSTEYSVAANRWRNVEVGRVVVFSEPSPYAGCIAAIVQIINAKRVLVEGPSQDSSKGVLRHAADLANVQLTPIVLEKLPFGVRPRTLKAKWEAAGIEAKWSSSTFAQTRERSLKRKHLTDFERFKAMKAKKQRRYAVRQELANIKKAES